MDRKERTIGIENQLSQQRRSFDWGRKAPSKKKRRNLNDDQTRIFDDDANLNTSNDTGTPYGIPADLLAEIELQQTKPTSNEDQPTSMEARGASSSASSMKTVLRRVKLKGVTFEDAQENIRNLGCRDIGSYALVREPDNKSDPNAIRVALFRRHFMGYIPKEIAAWLAPQMDAGQNFLAIFVSRNEHPDHKDRLGLTVDIVQLPHDEPREKEHCERPNDLAAFC
jgi:hypothetical protein